MSDPLTTLTRNAEELLQDARDILRDKTAHHLHKEACSYLEHKLMNFLVLLRSKPPKDPYEFIYVAGKWTGKTGWYYRSGIVAPYNWIGPFPSRKEAVSARLELVLSAGKVRTSYDAVMRNIFPQSFPTKEQSSV